MIGCGCRVCVCVAESWSWIGSVCTSRLDKAFPSVFLVSGILVWLLIFVIVRSSSPPQVHFWFKILLPSPPLFRPVAFQRKSSTSFFCPCHHSPKTHSNVYFCHFWFTQFDTHLYSCYLSLVYFPGEERETERRGAISLSID